jgi:hypothetical protein
MKWAPVVVAVAFACGGGGGRMAAPSLAPVDPTSALRAFMTAVENENITEMAGLWGTRNGLAADHMDREELVQRLTVMTRYLAHERYEIVEREPLLQSADEREFEVNMWHNNCQSTVPFTLVRASDGWLVKGVDLLAVENPARTC